MEKYINYIREYSKNNCNKIFRNPKGNLKYPFIVPGSCYNYELWDWDSWLTDIAIRQIMIDNNIDNKEIINYEKGCILNFIENMEVDGKIYIWITPENKQSGINCDKKTNIHKPCLAQHIAFIIKNNNDYEWIRPYIDKIDKFIKYYKDNCYHSDTGLFYWIDDFAIGVDNDPSTFYRPNNSSASIFLNCLMYKELLSVKYIYDCLGMDSKEYAIEAEKLKKAINDNLWDERNGFYYSADINLLPINKDEWLHRGCPRDWSCILQKIDSWSGFMTMWAGIAPKERAKRIVYENMMNKNLFNTNYGITTLAKTEPMYKIVKSGNPSCWLGPIWGISNYMCFRGLLNYGFNNEAENLARKTITLFGRSIEEHGELFEYYHPDTGEGVNNMGFQSWNLLVNNIIAWYKKDKTLIEEF